MVEPKEMASIIFVVEANLIVAKLVDIILKGFFGEVDLFDVVEDFIQFVQANVVRVMLDVAVDVVSDFIVFQ